jgi:hypothetical protein
MDKQTKKIFLIASIAVPFLIYCFYYYGMMIKNAPYKFAEFESITLKYGLGDKLINQFNSKTGIFQYENQNDSLITTKIKLNKDDLLYLHRKAADLGFWDFPEFLSGNKNSTHAANSPHYYLEFKYQRKTKHVLFDLNYNANPKLRKAIETLIEEVKRIIDDAEDRSQNK